MVTVHLHVASNDQAGKQVDDLNAVDGIRGRATKL